MESTSPDIRVEVTDGVARLTIDRPEARTALTWEAIGAPRAPAADDAAEGLTTFREKRPAVWPRADGGR